MVINLLFKKNECPYPPIDTIALDCNIQYNYCNSGCSHNKLKLLQATPKVHARKTYTMRMTNFTLSVTITAISTEYINF